MENPRREHTE